MFVTRRGFGWVGCCPLVCPERPGVVVWWLVVVGWCEVGCVWCDVAGVGGVDGGWFGVDGGGAGAELPACFGAVECLVEVGVPSQWCFGV